MSVQFIDLKTQYNAIKDDVNRRVLNVLDHGKYIMGPEVKELEGVLAEYTGAKHAIACSSGTDGGLLALMALGVGAGDEVITTCFSFFATAEIIAFLGATPVMVDIQKDTYNIDPDKLEDAITDKTKAIMPVSLYGQPADMDEINAIAKKHNLAVIEDGAQSFGATYKGKRSGHLSTLGFTSFYPAKPLGCYGDGGALFTSDDDLAEKVRMLLNHGQSGPYFHTAIGINGRLDSIQCAILLAKMERFDWEVARREEVAQKYTELLSDCHTPTVAADRQSVWAQYTIEVNDREGFQSKMKELGVPTAVHYPRTMADQPAMEGKCRSNLDLSVARAAAKRVVSLPMHPEMSDDTQIKIVDAVKTALK